MKWTAIGLATLTIMAICAPSQADFRCRGRRIVSPCFTPVCHEVVHHEAAIIAPTVTTIIQQPLPVFVFQNLQGYPALPASATIPQQPQQNFQAQPAPPGLALTDAQMDRIASLVAAKLAGGMVAQNTAIQASPPVLEEEQSLEMSQEIVNDIGAKCSSCHMTGTATKGGLAIFDKDRNFNPTKNGMPYASPEQLWMRAQAGEMPPAATTDPSKRLNASTIAFLKSALARR